MSEEPIGAFDREADTGFDRESGRESDLDRDRFARSSVDVTATVDRVWRALTTSAGLEPWLGAGASIDPVPNGELTAPDPVGGRHRHGRIERIDDRRLIELTWWPAEEPTSRSRVSITVTPIETGTRVDVVERPLPTSGRLGAGTGVASALAGVRTSLVGAWSWRLALLTVACQVVRA